MKASWTTALLALGLAAAEGASAAATKRSPYCTCCTALAKTDGLKDKIWTPEEERYDDRLSEYYSANAAQAPWCMVFPTSTDDVSKIVKVFNEHQCTFGMRSGAHSAFEGSNGIKDGVTVDFGNMTTTTYDESSQIASIQPGSDWGKVYESLAPYGVVAIGGRADVVGVGGFTTGGGYSFHTGVRGFACDNIRNFEVVLGDGSVVQANADENADLWTALKGGSGNFGFVTRLDAEVWPSSEIWASLNTFSLDQKPALRQVYYDFVLAQDDAPESQIIVSTTFSGGEWACSAVLSNINAEIAPAFDDVLALDAQTETPAKGPAHEVVPIFTGPTPLGLYANWQTGMLSHDLAIMEAVDEVVYDRIEAMRKVAPDADFELIWQWQPVTQGIVDVMNARGGNVLGLDAMVADGPVIMYNIVFTVDTAENQEVLFPLALEMNQAVRDTAAGFGGNKNWEFLNYAHGSQDPISHYGAENIALIKSVSDLYDSGKVFQNLRKTGFHLPA